MWRLFKVYEGIWKYTEVYKVSSDILNKSSSPSLSLSPTLFDVIRPYSTLFDLMLTSFDLI